MSVFIFTRQQSWDSQPSQSPTQLTLLELLPDCWWVSGYSRSSLSASFYLRLGLSVFVISHGNSIRSTYGFSVWVKRTQKSKTKIIFRSHGSPLHTPDISGCALEHPSRPDPGSQHSPPPSAGLLAVHIVTPYTNIAIVYLFEYIIHS